MNPCSVALSRRRVGSAGFTRSDLLAILGGASLLLAVCVPALATRTSVRSARILCVNNLRQVGAAWRMSATGFNDLFPFQIAGFFHGQISPQDAPASRWYQTISNELANPRILVCPNDIVPLALDFGSLNGGNISYAIGVDVGCELPRTILGADRNLTSGTPTGADYMDMPPEQAGSFSWDVTMHSHRGNLLQSDGSVQQYPISGLQQALRSSGGQTNRVLLPLP